MTRRKFDGVPTLPLFDEPERVGRSRRRSPRPVAHGRCPHCLGEKVAVDSSGSHLVWRQHAYVTWSGTHTVCSSSGVALCIAPARSEQTGPTVVCRHLDDAS